MQKSGGIKRILSFITIFFLLLSVVILMYIAGPALQNNLGGWLDPWFNRQAAGSNGLPVGLANLTTTTPLPTPTYSTAWQDGLGKQGTIIFSMRDGIYYHLFAYHPLFLPVTRLTNNAWDDINPSISPDGNHIAFSSRRNGYWDIYILDITTNQTTRLTDTPAYDGAPAWSPDGQWIVYESYVEDNLEILIRSVGSPSQDPINLSNAAGLDCSPAWSPQGRDIAFVSDRSGKPEIWLARLDQSDNRYVQISQSKDGSSYEPHWSPDGTRIAWVVDDDIQKQIVSLDLQNNDQELKQLGIGENFVWSPLGDMVLVSLPTANHTELGSYLVDNGEMFYPPVKIAGSLKGLDWKLGQFPLWLENIIKQGNAQSPAAHLWQASNSINPPPPGGRTGVVPVANLTAPYPYLHDSVDEAYNALRAETHKEIGWNFLDSLASAFTPLTEPPSPNMGINWLYTGRAFAVNPTPYYASWMLIVRDNIGGQIYWHIYLKARFQDGSQGEPVKRTPWDFKSRYTGDPQSFEQGGTEDGIPPGYWIDFTDLALTYSWQRLAALPTWRTYFEAARFNQFYMDNGLSYEQAMQNIYPPEALATRTYVPTQTVTLTPTRKDFTPSTPTPTPTITLTPTLNPTWTPVPGN